MDFEWINPADKNGPISFLKNGSLQTPFGEGSWTVVDTETITLKFGRLGEMTLHMNADSKGQEWNVIRPKKSA